MSDRTCTRGAMAPSTLRTLTVIATTPERFQWRATRVHDGKRPSGAVGPECSYAPFGDVGASWKVETDDGRVFGRASRDCVAYTSRLSFLCITSFIRGSSQQEVVHTADRGDLTLAELERVMIVLLALKTDMASLFNRSRVLVSSCWTPAARPVAVSCCASTRSFTVGSRSSLAPNKSTNSRAAATANSSAAALHELLESVLDEQEGYDLTNTGESK